MIRYAIWCAVSTRAQAAEDKISLKEQETRCREAALSKGWRETHKPFIAAGFSRTKWIDLAPAAKAIPALGDLIASARRHEYDVLVIWDFTRLRALMNPLADALADQGIQIFSVAQPHEIEDPKTFAASQSDTAEILRKASDIASSMEGHHRKRRRKIGMLARVEHGYQPGIVPFGYRKPAGMEESSHAPIELDPERARLIYRLKDLFLSGHSLPQLVEAANASGISAPRGGEWVYSTVRRLLLNPYYAGLVTYGKIVSTRDRMQGITIRTNAEPEHVTIARGRHEPLWDMDTHQLIRAEFKRRGHAYPGRRTRQLTQLLRCGVCGATLYTCYASSSRRRLVYWKCSRAATHRWRGHIHLSDRALLEIVGLRIAAELRQSDAPKAGKAVADPRPEIRRRLEDLQRRRARWQEAFETETLDAVAFQERTAELSERMAEARDELAQATAEIASRAERRAARVEMAKLAEHFPQILHTAEPQEMNARLRQQIDHIVVNVDRTIKIVWRD